MIFVRPSSSQYCKIDYLITISSSYQFDDFHYKLSQSVLIIQAQVHKDNYLGVD